MRIAICDDNSADANMIRYALSDIGSDLDIVCFSSGQELLSAIKNGDRIDLAFLDIYMEGEDGISTAKRLRKLSPATEIIFSTVSSEHAVEAFRVHAADYLVKPYTDMEVIRAFARVSIRQSEKAREKLLFQTGRTMTVLDSAEVVKLESDRHYTVITLSGGKTTRLLMNYSDTVKRFQEGFLELKRGLTVNMRCITELHGAEAVLTDGSVYSIPKGRRDEVIREYTRFLTGG